MHTYGTVPLMVRGLHDVVAIAGGTAEEFVLGDRDTVLVDTFTTIEQNEAVVQWVRDHDGRLTHVY